MSDRRLIMEKILGSLRGERERGASGGVGNYLEVPLSNNAGKNIAREIYSVRSNNMQKRTRRDSIQKKEKKLKGKKRYTNFIPYLSFSTKNRVIIGITR